MAEIEEGRKERADGGDGGERLREVHVICGYVCLTLQLQSKSMGHFSHFIVLARAWLRNYLQTNFTRKRWATRISCWMDQPPPYTTTTCLPLSHLIIELPPHVIVFSLFIVNISCVCYVEFKWVLILSITLYMKTTWNRRYHVSGVIIIMPPLLLSILEVCYLALYDSIWYMAGHMIDDG